MSRVASSFHEKLPDSFTSSAPVIAAGCQTQNTAPVGSMNAPMVPWSMTWKGAIRTCPPASLTLLAVSSAFAVAMYVDQDGGWFGFIGGVAAATDLPLRKNML